MLHFICPIARSSRDQRITAIQSAFSAVLGQELGCLTELLPVITPLEKDAAPAMYTAAPAAPVFWDKKQKGVREMWSRMF